LCCWQHKCVAVGSCCCVMRVWQLCLWWLWYFYCVHSTTARCGWATLTTRWFERRKVIIVDMKLLVMIFLKNIHVWQFHYLLKLSSHHVCRRVASIVTRAGQNTLCTVFKILNTNKSNKILWTSNYWFHISGLAVQ